MRRWLARGRTRFAERISDYSFEWLDDLCRSGRTVWTRIADAAVAARERGRAGAGDADRCCRATHAPAHGPRARIGPTPCRFPRAHARCRSPATTRRPFSTRLPRPRACSIPELGGCARRTGRPRAGEFGRLAGLRALLMPASRRSAPRGCRLRRANLLGVGDAGRWAASAAASAPPARPMPTTKPARRSRAPCARHGVVSWRLLARGRLAAAVARTRARLSSPRSTRRNPRRTFRARPRRRTVRPAGSDSAAAQGAPNPRGPPGSSSPPPIR